jgi:tRNASer (uridine44-2'-O)-methyltransferase
MILLDSGSPEWQWHSSPVYRLVASDTILHPSKFLEVTDLLLANPNLNSSHLFRADILFDSAKKLKTRAEQERDLNCGTEQPLHAHDGEDADCDILVCDAPQINGAIPYRTVVRRLIPRNTNIDRPLKQSCFFYREENEAPTARSQTVVLVPQVGSEAEIPWYHPSVKGLAYVLELDAGNGQAALAVWYTPFLPRSESHDPPQRLHRTLLALCSTFMRLARYQGASAGDESKQSATQLQDNDSAELDLRPSSIKDTILPQHVVQDTYARMKSAYASHLIAEWVEATPPEKHVFEDIAIAAFLVCLWKHKYGDSHRDPFTGFIDMACGNGLLVWLLNKEGWKGYGLDARRRKTWEKLGLERAGLVLERTIVPRPFVEALGMTANHTGALELEGRADVLCHDGIFEPGSFIISNHADELTLWTPLLAALASETEPLAFIDIPCCSHGLSGEKKRYSPNEVRLRSSAKKDKQHLEEPAAKPATAAEQPPNGDLKALRAQKLKERSGADDKSMYACLTKKVVQLSRDLHLDTTCTLLRIPSTRNIGVVHIGGGGSPDGQEHVSDGNTGLRRQETARQLIEAECARSGGVKRSAEIWIERALKLHAGQGRGKVNLGHKPGDASRVDLDGPAAG